MRFFRSTLLVISLAVTVSKSFASASSEVVKGWGFPSCDPSWKVCMIINNTEDTYSVKLVETDQGSEIMWMQEPDMPGDTDVYDMLVHNDGGVYLVVKRIANNYEDRNVYTRIGRINRAQVKAAGPQPTGVATEFVPDLGVEVSVHTDFGSDDISCDPAKDRPGKYKRTGGLYINEQMTITRNGTILAQPQNGFEDGMDPRYRENVTSVPCDQNGH